MPVHSVELLHLVMLSINVQDNCTASFITINAWHLTSLMIGFKSSDWAIINSGASAELDIERQLSLRDPGERKLDLRLSYV